MKLDSKIQDLQSMLKYCAIQVMPNMRPGRILSNSKTACKISLHRQNNILRLLLERDSRWDI
jgi:hypothetical protein